MELNSYMEHGIKSISSTVSAFYLNNLKGIKFISGFVPSLARASRLRKESEKNGLHIPPFIIASISSKCNLHCIGCYARADGMCTEGGRNDEMTAEEWKKIFTEADEIGVSFILLAGGEPLIRKDVINTAAEFKHIAFPVFTNGTLIDDEYIEFFDKNRNMIPVISMEGDSAQTDIRRGEGVAESIAKTMAELKKRGILFAVSVTVTSENLCNAVTEEYLNELREKGCGVVFYVEYVPAEKGTERLVLSHKDTEWLNNETQRLKKIKKDMTILCFPGDEEYMEGCLAAGRGFFHIAPDGSAEPCPFSPFSVHNMKRCSIKEVLESRFFSNVRDISRNEKVHNGGCTLFNHENEVRKSIEN